MEAVRDGSSGSQQRLPTGEITFLFTDIEGSTVRWERAPLAMQHALRRHDALMREAIVETGGCVFKTVGDAFYAVFQHPREALEGAIDAQRRLGNADFSEVEGLRVRMALHVGFADERDGDYFGQTLNRVARLLSIGHGGQILLSHACAQRIGADLPVGSSLADLGEHRLKDLTAPEHVFQFVSDDLQRDFPKLRSLSVLDNNLPQQLSPLIGRDSEVAAIKARLNDSRLVTLLGAGGVGKTRCALQVGAELLDSFNDGVWFVDLAPTSDPALVANAIGAVFELQESGSHPMTDSLVAHFKSKKLLLVLDNCEHLIAEVSSLATAILHACDGVKVLATSREHFNVAGEALYRMPSLAVPEPTLSLSADDALAYGAVLLFVARAQAVNPRFELTDENAALVAAICGRLDGIPLAIELAAARVAVLSLKQLAERLDERFRLLTSGNRTALPRQQTMRATIDWSYDLLTAEEQQVFRIISIFVGPFAFETAAVVCADSGLGEYDVLTIVSSLAYKSLLNAESADADEVRYRLLESTRQYAAEKLAESGQHDSIAALHAQAYADLAERIVGEYDSMPYRAWAARAEAEIENVRAALHWAFDEAGDATVGQRLAATLNRLMPGSSGSEAYRWVEIAIEHTDATTDGDLAGRLALARAHLSVVLNQYTEAFAAAEEAMRRFDASTNPRGKADAQRWAGRALLYLGRGDEGEALLEAALATHRRLRSRSLGGTLRDLAVARGAAGDVERSRQYFAEALRDFERHHDEGAVAQTAATLAGVEFGAGNVDAAVEIAEKALEAARTLKRRRMTAWILGELATFSIARNAFADARARAREAIVIARDQGWSLYIAFALQHLATEAALSGDRERGARLLGFVDRRLDELRTVREAAEQAEYERARAALLSVFGAAQLEELSSDGAELTEDQAIAISLSA